MFDDFFPFYEILANLFQVLQFCRPNLKFLWGTPSTVNHLNFYDGGTPHHPPGAHLWKGAYFRKDPGHWVFSVLRVLLAHGQHVRTVGGKFAAEEKVHEVNLPNDVDEIQKFAEEKLKGVSLVVFPVD